MHHAYIDKFAYQDSPVHRLDSRLKLIVVIVFTGLVISMPRTCLSILFCYAVGPFAFLVIGRIPLKFVFKQILLVSPFVLVLALTSPFYDKSPMNVAFGPFVWETTTGWMRCYVIVGKFAVTMMALIALVSTTRFNNLLVGLQKLGVPRLLVVQLGFIYRYIFLVIDRAQHILRARSGRRLRNVSLSKELRIAGAMVGSLLVRSIDTAEHINIAMQARGFDGHWRTLSRLRIRWPDLLFLAASGFFMIVIYVFILPVLW
jgi:cobalt/nickel transport system permease protein